MRSLFVKVFVWFWVASTLSGVALFLIGLATQTGPPAEHRRRAMEQWRHLTGQTLVLYGERAATLLEHEASRARNYTRRVEQATGIRVVLVLRRHDTILDRRRQGRARLAARAGESGTSS
jgi:hypothetical protein